MKVIDTTRETATATQDSGAEPSFNILQTRSKKYGFTCSFFEDDGFVGHQVAMDSCEPAASDLFLRLLKSNSTVLDIGANLGYYSLLANTIVKDGRVFSFEPSSANFSLLQKNLEDNNAATVQPFQLAVGEAPSLLTLYLCKRSGVTLNHGDHRLWETYQGELEETEEVFCISIDQFEPLKQLRFGINNPLVVKIDTQGWEYSVLKGMTALLETTPEVLMLTEFSPDAYPLLGFEGEEYYEFLKKHFDSIYIIDDYMYRCLPVHTYSLIPKYCAARKHTHANIFAVRGVKTYPSNGFAI